MEKEHIFKVGDEVALKSKESTLTTVLTIDEIGFENPYTGLDYFICKREGYDGRKYLTIYYIEDAKKKKCFEFYPNENRTYYKFEKITKNA